MVDVFTDPATTSTRAPRVQNYRYKLLNPETNKPETWTRVTTFAKTLAETSALNAWELRMAVKGLAMDPSQLAGDVKNWDVSTHKGALQSIATTAKERAGSKDGADRGTRMHDITELHDLGNETPFITDEERNDLEAYKAGIASRGIKAPSEFVELFVAVPEFKVCGKLDRIYGVPSLPGLNDYVLQIGDLKTAKNIEYNWLEIAIQLALYSMATHYWHVANDSWAPMPVVSQTTAQVAHLRVGAAQCDIYDLDLQIGREACEVARAVRGLRSRKDIAKLTTTTRVESPYADRLRACSSRDELSLVWKEASCAGEWNAELESIGHVRMKEIG